ncbi:hypothetical protein M5689_024573 [Euphorbia peplus]|nr:hypothetical protein M5689_024573 [Euphorbia peplus]
MILFYWNCRGIGNAPTQNRLSNFCRQFKPDFLCLAEPMVDFSSILISLWNSLNLTPIATNIGSPASIWVFCNRNVQTQNIVQVITNAQHITLDVNISTTTYRFSFVYGKVSHVERCFLWSDLSNSAGNFTGPWSIMGDFNAMRGAHEKTGGPPLNISCREFNSFLDNCDMTEIDTKGPFFTWTNGRHGRAHVECKLDRVVGNFSFHVSWSKISSVALPRHSSDHSPLILQFENNLRMVSRFRFHNMWLTDARLKEVVEFSWNQPCYPLPPMLLLSYKLKRLKFSLKSWNRDVFGNVNDRVVNALNILEALQIEISTDGSLQKDTKLNCVLMRILKRL